MFLPQQIVKKHDKICGCRTGNDFLQANAHPLLLADLHAILVGLERSSLPCCCLHNMMVIPSYNISECSHCCTEIYACLSGVLPCCPLQQVWSGSKRAHGMFLHSPMMDELKSLEAMLLSDRIKQGKAGAMPDQDSSRTVSVELSDDSSVSERVGSALSSMG